METNNIINITEGFEIDKEQSTERQIVLRKIDNRARSWEEYCKKMEGKSSYYYDGLFEKIKSSKFGSSPLLAEFEDKEDIETLVAFCKLFHLRRDWVGEWKPDWKNKKQWKFSIVSDTDKIEKGIGRTLSRSLSFPTEKMRDEFFDTFKDLLDQAKILL